MSKAGKRFNLYAEVWPIDLSKNIYIKHLRGVCPENLFESGLRALAHSIEKLAVGTVIARFWGLVDFFSVVDAESLKAGFSVGSLAAYRHHCLSRDGHGDVFSSRLRPLLKDWLQLGCSGVTSELIEEIASWSTKHPERAVAVNTLDPDRGPLTQLEETSLLLLVTAAYERGDIKVGNYCMLRVLFACGRRPLQIVQIKLGDLDDSFIEQEVDGKERRLKTIKIPRLKAKGGLWRTRFRAVPLSDDLWELVMVRRESLITTFDALLGKNGLTLAEEFRSEIYAQLPLFLSWNRVESSIAAIASDLNNAEIKVVSEKILRLAEGPDWHMSSQSVGPIISDESVKLNVVGRTGRNLHLFPRRVRYTYQARLERAGCSDSVIAWNMDHSDLLSLNAYRKNGPEKAAVITKVMALKMEKFTRVFLGQVIDSEAAINEGSYPEKSRIYIDGKEGATCKTLRGCGMVGLPRPCYAGCPHFRPWLDGPHEQFLEIILNERQRDIEAGLPDQVVAANDHLIIGIAQVIRTCEIRRQQIQDEDSRSAN